MKLLALTLICTLVFLGVCADSSQNPGKPTPHAEMVAFRTPGGMLETHGFTRTETFHKDTGSFLGTTSSEIRLSATYRYAIELRQKWNLYIDDTRHIAFVIAPAFHPQLPVAVDSRSVFTWTESGWGRFNKWDNLQALHREISGHLETLAQSKEYIELGRKSARVTVEEFVTDWILKNRGWPVNCVPFVKVYFEDEQDIPLPEKTKMTDFLP
jgi:hypothetical protein